ncbi:SDR family oxidoreductase [Methylosinus sp. LW4]|uniref:SDR family oxidoreductase n=1 Tax=Methylosinus sp. LW4 TaxID=136993 RepID=UPI00037EDFE6|nr:SDR family oxidoreductase [Methylosinus sp. LW4]
MPNQERVAIVTGASRGIGRATAIRLARDFSAVVLVARDAIALASVAEAVSAAGAASLTLSRDLRVADAAREAIETTRDRFGRIDALVNIAGAVPQADLFAMSEEEWTDGLSLKFHAARRLTLAAWETLVEYRGSVVFISGTSALTPKASLAAVGTINAAISALAKAFAERGVGDGVQVNAVLPGPVLTDRRRAMLALYGQAKGLSIDTAMNAFAAETKITRYGTPEDIAELIAFAISPAARWMTGVTLRMDGGEIKSI